MNLRQPQITKINGHIYLINDNNEATGYVVVGRERALVIDTMIGLVNMRAVADKLTDLPLLLVNTHGHCDHIGGNWSFEKAYLHPADFALAAAELSQPAYQQAIQESGLQYPAFSPVEDEQILSLGGLDLQIYTLPGHTTGEIVLLDRQDKILFSGDAVLEQLWLQLPDSLPVQEQIAGMERLLPLRSEFEIILSGHSREAQGAELFDELLAGLKDLASGNTASDTDYVWFGGTARAHRYGREPRQIVYTEYGK